MIGLGIFVFLFGYTVLYWAIQGFQGNAQAPFLSYLLPFAK